MSSKLILTDGVQGTKLTLEGCSDATWEDPDPGSRGFPFSTVTCTSELKISVLARQSKVYQVRRCIEAHYSCTLPFMSNGIFGWYDTIACQVAGSGSGGRVGQILTVHGERPQSGDAVERRIEGQEEVHAPNMKPYIDL